jgi:hypothetical protein
MNFRTALAKPSFSLLSVTALACAFTSSVELPIAIEKPLLRNLNSPHQNVFRQFCAEVMADSSLTGVCIESSMRILLVLKS